MDRVYSSLKKMTEFDLWAYEWKKYIAWWLVAINYYYGWWVGIILSFLSLAYILIFLCDWSALNGS